MKRFILTGTPGAGKTSLIRLLETLGHFVVEEAATDVIALEQAQGVQEPWTSPLFIDKIVAIQKQRQLQTSRLPAELQFFDRSPIDTYALSLYLERLPSSALLEEIQRVRTEEVYQGRVFFIENLGFCQPSEARKISLTEALRFEKIHEEAYAAWGYECLKIGPQTVAERTHRLLSLSS